MALVLTTAACEAAEFVGWPEARIPLAEATIYVATAHKSNSAVCAIDAALEDVRSNPTQAVPKHLQDGSYAGAARLGRGEGYQYSHDHPNHFVPQEYMESVRRFYEPTEQGVERKIKERLDQWRQQMDVARQQRKT
jgi:putative ATPase